MIHILYFFYFFPCVWVSMYIILDVKNEITKRNGKKAQFIDKDKEYEKNIWQQCWRQQKNWGEKKFEMSWNYFETSFMFSYNSQQYHIASSSLSHLSLIFPPNFTYSLHLYCLIYLTFYILMKCSWMRKRKQKRKT